MLQAIERICRYTKGKNFEDFIADDMMYYAVVKNIEILGEASNMLTEEFRQAHPKTPWKQANMVFPSLDRLSYIHCLLREFLPNKNYKRLFSSLPAPYPYIYCAWHCNYT